MIVVSASIAAECMVQGCLGMLNETRTTLGRGEARCAYARELSQYEFRPSPTFTLITRNHRCASVNAASENSCRSKSHSQMHLQRHTHNEVSRRQSIIFALHATLVTALLVEIQMEKKNLPHRCSTSLKSMEKERNSFPPLSKIPVK